LITTISTLLFILLVLCPNLLGIYPYAKLGLIGLFILLGVIFQYTLIASGKYKLLGHVSVVTTEIYARAHSKQKRDALEKAYVDVNPDDEAMWLKDENLISWLKRF